MSPVELLVDTLSTKRTLSAKSISPPTEEMLDATMRSANISPTFESTDASKFIVPEFAVMDSTVSRDMLDTSVPTKSMDPSVPTTSETMMRCTLDNVFAEKSMVEFASSSDFMVLVANVDVIETTPA